MNEVQAAALARAQGRRRIVFPRPGPQLTLDDAPRATLLAADLFRETRGRERFSAFPVCEFSAAAGIIVRYRIHSLEILRQTQKDARAMFLRDLREAGRLPFPEMKLLLQIIGHFPPRQLQVRPSAKDPAYEELVIPERLREFAVSHSGISGIRKPDVLSFYLPNFCHRWKLLSITQAIANYIRSELARGRNKVPAYTPFIVPEASAAPWAIDS